MADSQPTRRSLRLELIATLVVLLMMAVVSLSLANEMLGRQRHEADQRRQLSEHVQALGALVAPRLGSDSPAAADTGEVERVLRSSMGTLGIESIELSRFRSGTVQVVVSLGATVDAPPPDQATTTSPQTVFEHGDHVIVDRTLRTFGADPNATMMLRVAARPSPWTRQQDWRAVLVLALGVGLVLLVLGIGLLELQVIRPLAHVRTAATELAAGNLDARAPAEGPAELQALAEAFNTMAGSLRDRIGQVESQRERLVRAERLASVGRLSAGIAHEVGNPLAAILGYVELLLDPRAEPALPEEHRALLLRSQTQIQRIQSIVTQLLDYARPAEQDLHEIAVVPAVSQLLALLRHDPRCDGVELEVVGDESVRVLATPGPLDQVLQNLVVNAARAARSTQTPPRVRIIVREVPRTAEHDDVERGGSSDPTTVVAIEVADSGPGIPAEVRPQLFEPFFTTSKAGEGTGLGLAICQGLAQTLGGSLLCLEPEADAEFSGAVFRVTLRKP